MVNWKKDDDNIDVRLSSEAMRVFEARENDLIEYQELIRKQEKQLDDYRAQLKQEQLDREKQIQIELHARERFFADREKKIFERQENLQLRQNEIAELKNKLEAELAYRESELQQALQNLKLEKERYTEDSRRKIELKSKDYVSETIDTLNQKEIQFHLISKVWSGVGAASLISRV